MSGSSCNLLSCLYHALQDSVNGGSVAAEPDSNAATQDALSSAV